MIDAEQRYKQALRKARLISNRNLRNFMAGKIDACPCSGNIERAAIIAEFDRLHRLIADLRGGE